MNARENGNDTIDAGTQPSVVGDPIERPVLAPQFEFPDGLRGLPKEGPFGAMSQDLPTWTQPPRLGYAGFPGLRTITLICQPASPFRWEPIDITQPVVLLPVNTTIPAGALGTAFMRYAPAATGTSIAGGGVNDRHGFYAQRLAAHLFAPGRWFLSLAGPDTERIAFMMIPAEDRTIAEQLMFRTNSGGQGLTQIASVGLAAATATNVLELNVAMFQDFLRVVNVGANPVRLKWSGTPTALDGFGIAAQAHLDFYPEHMACARLRGFSTAGTTVEVWSQRRNWAS